MQAKALWALVGIFQSVQVSVSDEVGVGKKALENGFSALRLLGLHRVIQVNITQDATRELETI